MSCLQGGACKGAIKAESHLTFDSIWNIDVVQHSVGPLMTPILALTHHVPKPMTASMNQCSLTCVNSSYSIHELVSTSCIHSTLRSWLHWISTRLKFCPLDWRTTIHWNVAQAIFQHNHICQDHWKNIRSTFECMVLLKSRGQGPFLENYGTNLSLTFNKNLDLVPWIGE